MARLIALLRGINVGGNRKVPMAELRAACSGAGLGTVATYIQSGNLVLDGADAAAIETALEALVKERFGHDISVVARTAADWDTLIAACPFQTEAKDDPGRTVLLVSKKTPAQDAVEALAGRAKHGERIARCGAGIAIYYPSGQADSKLTPTLVDRLIGSPATARNWTTVIKLAEMAKA
jgi:uncharacterized protein (DUF1697 family)